MKIYRFVQRKSGLDEWEQVPGSKIYVHPQIAKGQKTRLTNEVRSYWKDGYTYAVQVADTTDWVNLIG